MILVAGSDASVAAALPGERRRVDGAADLPDAVPPRSVLLVAPDDVADPAALVSTARARADGPLIVVAVTETPFAVERERYDGVVTPDADEATVRAVVEHARSLVSYRDAVADLYEECRRGRRLRRARERADDRFDDLPELDEDDLAAILRAECDD